MLNFETKANYLIIIFNSERHFILPVPWEEMILSSFSWQTMQKQIFVTTMVEHRL